MFSNLGLVLIHCSLIYNNSFHFLFYYAFYILDILRFVILTGYRLFMTYLYVGDLRLGKLLEWGCSCDVKSFNEKCWLQQQQLPQKFYINYNFRNTLWSTSLLIRANVLKFSSQINTKYFVLNIVWKETSKA